MPGSIASSHYARRQCHTVSIHIRVDTRPPPHPLSSTAQSKQFPRVPGTKILPQTFRFKNTYRKRSLLLAPDRHLPNWRLHTVRQQQPRQVMSNSPPFSRRRSRHHLRSPAQPRCHPASGRSNRHLYRRSFPCIQHPPRWRPLLLFVRGGRL